MKLFDLYPGDRIWLYIIEPMNECFPIVEKEYVVDYPFVGSVDVTSVDTGKRSNRHINFFDEDISAIANGKIYIWLSEKNLRKAYDIVKRYYMKKLDAAAKEMGKLATVFENMSSWEDIFRNENEFNQCWSHTDVEEVFE